MKPIDDIYRDKYDFTILVLQGGGALGAYQAGVFEGLVEAGFVPNWIAGVSIGSVNAALIAGNPPDRRVERLREFWNLVTSGVPSELPGEYAFADPQRLWTNRLSAAASATFGVPGFYTPRVPPAFLAPAGSNEALSFYDNAELEATLEKLVDFDRINRGPVRLSLGAVDVETGNSTYFDSVEAPILARHVLASGALPPAFAPVEIGDRFYWDGGIASNTPLWYVLDSAPRMRALIVQVDLFSAAGERPRDLDQVLERRKDIAYSSKTRFNTTRVRELQRLRSAAHRLLGKLPAELRSDPDTKALEEMCDCTHIDIVHLINRPGAYSSSSKDYEFSRATMRWRWNAGLEDVRRSVAHPDWLKGSQLAEGIRVYDLTGGDGRGEAVLEREHA
ncbi:MAG TPA: patatin-like phospholipase family protein [Burkholderiales bacterium]|nr:patatin-like phospholipase family protein [Burkholderiales bacterium]